ncbi:hypothetical protein ACHAPT_006185 [Fusarium lateritium]
MILCGGLVAEGEDDLRADEEDDAREHHRLNQQVIEDAEEDPSKDQFVSESESELEAEGSFCRENDRGEELNYERYGY